jgi:exonuclease SbcD
MRVVHSSDWHLGQELAGFGRTAEHERFLDWLGQRLVELEADALVVTGDIFDSANPSATTIRQLYRFLQGVQTKCPRLDVLIIGGNHDSPGRLEMPVPLLDGRRVRVVGAMPRVDGKPQPEKTLIPLHDKDNKVRILCGAVPFLRGGDVPAAHSDDPAAGIRRLYSEVMEAAEAARSGAGILLTGHLYVQGSVPSEFSERPIIIGGEHAVPVDIFPAAADYVALGHLHKPQVVGGRSTVRYAGSPFPMSVAERDYRHAIQIVDFAADNKVKNVTSEPIPRPVDYIRVPRTGAVAVDAAIDELRSLVVATDPGLELRPFLEVAVQLTEPTPDLRKRIDDTLNGKPVRLVRVKQSMDGAGIALADVKSSGELIEIRPVDVFSECHKQKFGTEPGVDLTRAFEQLVADVQLGESAGNGASP